MAFKDFDELTVTVKSDRAEEITAYYSSLGWKKAEEAESKRFFNEINLTFHRPHGIENKDDLQLLQVYLDNGLNGLAKLNASPYPLTLSLGITFGLIFSALVAFGVCLAVLVGGIWLAGGISIACIGGVSLVVYGFTMRKLFLKERERSKIKRAELERTISAVISEGERLRGGANV
ncbi:MAG: hypothetical protein HDQ88_10730 [Clostridia bacterium]|nr:hypothetical protein [Clostridia bacterium]